MTEPLIPLPEPREQSPEDYLQISRRDLQQARLHLEESDRLQSEKVSGAAAEALKAIGKQRNWRHDSHAIRASIASQLSAELGRSSHDAQTLYRGKAFADQQHSNFFENFLLEDAIQEATEAAEALVDIIERMMNESPRSFTVATRSEAHRISQLTGHRPDIGDTDALGFANFEGALRGQ